METSFEIKPPDTLEAEEDPENAPSLLAFLEKRGDVSHVTQAQLYKARNLYVTKFWQIKQVAKTLGLPSSVIERWNFAYDWDEERNRRLFQQFQRINGQRSKRSRNIDERADSIFHGIERVAEQILQEHMDAPEGSAGTLQRLGIKDLASLAKTVKDCHETRRLIHGKSSAPSVSKQEVKIEVTGDLFSQVGHMLQKVIAPQIGLNKPKITVQDLEDVEFEEIIED